MPINPASAFATASLQATYSPTRKGVSGPGNVGSSATATLTSATESVAFQVELDVDFKVEIPLNTLIPAITGGSGQPQTATLTIVAPGGITSNGNLAVTIAGAYTVEGTYQVPVTTALTTATAIAAAIAGDSGIQTALAEYIVGSLAADASFEDLTNRTNDPTFAVSVAAGLGVSAATSVTTQLGGAPAKCYSLPGTTYTGENLEGGEVAAPDAYYAAEILPVGTNGMLAYTATLQEELADGEVFHKHAAGGLASITPSDTLTLEALSGPVTALVILQFSTT